MATGIPADRKSIRPQHHGVGPRRTADVHHQHHRQLALLAELLDEGVARAGGHVPVDRADVIAGHVFTHLLELHPLALEGAVVLAREDIRHDPPADADVADLLDFGGIMRGSGHRKGFHGGFRSRHGQFGGCESIRSSGVISSASAS
jgi:hypothetical protein